MMLQKVLFLDFEGVLTTDRTMQLAYSDKSWVDDFGLKFDPESVENLQSIIDSTHCRIVAITSWKAYGIDYLQSMWQQRQMPAKIDDVVPSTRVDFVSDGQGGMRCAKIPCRNKGEEIDAWIESELMEGRETRYCIFDDNQCFSSAQQSRFVQIDCRVGISSHDASQAISLLSFD